jgi:hypothetical protein
MSGFDRLQSPSTIDTRSTRGGAGAQKMNSKNFNLKKTGEHRTVAVAREERGPGDSTDG